MAACDDWDCGRSVGRAFGFLDMSAEIGDLDEGFPRASDSAVMILTCPQCATGYFVEDGQIRPGGRTVRCAACGTRWTAHPQGPLDLVRSDEEGALAKEPATSAEDATLAGEDLPRAFRDKAEEDRRTRRALLTGVVWAAAAVVVALLIALGLIFRDGVVRAWPQTASLYAAIGLPVNPTGLTIEDIHAEPSLEQGHATWVVSAVIRNVTDHDVTAPPLKITLLNGQGKVVVGQIATLDNARIPPGESRHFATSIFDPPFSAVTLGVDFALDVRPQPAMHLRSAGPPPPPPTPAFTLRGETNDAPAANAAAPTPAAAPAANAATAP
jgi:predicted Zn finger-like uncharacterized protein